MSFAEISAIFAGCLNAFRLLQNIGTEICTFAFTGRHKFLCGRRQNGTDFHPVAFHIVVRLLHREDIAVSRNGHHGNIILQAERVAEKFQCRDIRTGSLIVQRDLQTALFDHIDADVNLHLAADDARFGEERLDFFFEEAVHTRQLHGTVKITGVDALDFRRDIEGTVGRNGSRTSERSHTFQHIYLLSFGKRFYLIYSARWNSV